jgi:hypothetical protein
LQVELLVRPTLSPATVIELLVRSLEHLLVLGLLFGLS